LSVNVANYCGSRYKFGDIFIEIPLSEAQDRLQKDKDALNQEIDTIKDTMDSMNNKMAELKVILYAKFKNSINLEKD
jgi:prefoldin subunit 4